MDDAPTDLNGGAVGRAVAARVGVYPESSAPLPLSLGRATSRSLLDRPGGLRRRFSAEDTVVGPAASAVVKHGQPIRTMADRCRPLGRTWGTERTQGGRTGPGVRHPRIGVRQPWPEVAAPSTAPRPLTRHRFSQSKSSDAWFVLVSLGSRGVSVCLRKCSGGRDADSRLSPPCAGGGRGLFEGPHRRALPG